MFSECANPDCKKEFDYREGRFFRFRKAYLDGRRRPNTHCVQHLWLCGSCSKKYTLGYEDERDIAIILPHLQPSGEQGVGRFVAVA
jgi:hypothetical protein